MSKEPIKTVTTNRKAKFNYHILDTFEAGMVLRGNEIKSIREGGVTINEAYVKIENDEIFLIGAHINEYSHSAGFEYNPTRARKLLLHKTQISKIRGSVEKKGTTIVPLKIYLKARKAKIEIAIAKGKNAPDKKKTKINQEKKREAERYLKNNY